MRIPVQIGLVLASAAIATQGYAGGPDNPFTSDNAVAADSLDGYRGDDITGKSDAKGVLFWMTQGCATFRNRAACSLQAAASGNASWRP